MVNLPPVDGLIPTRDEPKEGGVSRLQRLDGQVSGGAAVGVQVQGAEQRGEDAAFRRVYNKERERDNKSGTVVSRVVRGTDTVDVTHSPRPVQSEDASPDLYDVVPSM